MMQPELLVQPSWPVQSYFHSNLDHQYGVNMGFYGSEILDRTPENSSPVSSVAYYPMVSDEGEYPPVGYDQMQKRSPSEIVSENMETLDDVCRWLCDDDQGMEEFPLERSTEGGEVWSPSLSMKSSDVASEYQSPMVQTNDAMETDSQGALDHLLEAYAQAMEMGQRELAGVIVKCISEKASPVGQALERIALHLFQCGENHGEEYLKQESRMNLKAAFRAFYDIFPYGRFAHFTANSAILEAIPSHVDSIHIVDFDTGEGIQWPPVMEAVARKGKSLRITSVKPEEHDSGFEETKRQLFLHARRSGLNLKVEEMAMAELVKEIEGTEGREFLAFNCMVGLPHMGRTRRRTEVMEFLKIAKALLAKREGILTFGDGEDSERMGNSSGYTSFFDGYLAHYKALYESLEWGFPSYLLEARIAMETLFLAPYVSSLSWFEKWEERREDTVSLKGLGLRAQPMSRENCNENKEMVKEGESPYKIRIEGDCQNEMVLEWRGTPLVRVSAWM